MLQGFKGVCLLQGTELQGGALSWEATPLKKVYFIFMFHIMTNLFCLGLLIIINNKLLCCFQVSLGNSVGRERPSPNLNSKFLTTSSQKPITLTSLWGKKLHGRLICQNPEFRWVFNHLSIFHIQSSCYVNWTLEFLNLFEYIVKSIVFEI